MFLPHYTIHDETFAELLTKVRQDLHPFLVFATHGLNVRNDPKVNPKVNLKFWENLANNAHVYPHLDDWSHDEAFKGLAANIRRTSRFFDHGFHENTRYPNWEKELLVYRFPFLANFTPNGTQQYSTFITFSTLTLAKLVDMYSGDLLRVIVSNDEDAKRAICQNPNPCMSSYIEFTLSQAYATVMSETDVCAIHVALCNMMVLLNMLSYNTNPEVVHLMEKYDIFRSQCATYPIYVENLHGKTVTTSQCWSIMSANPAYIAFMERHSNKICWYDMSKNPSGMALLERTPDKIDWRGLSENPSAVEMLRANPDKIDYVHLAKNPRLVEVVAHLNKDKMARQIETFREELLTVVLHPVRIMRISEQWNVTMEEYVGFIG